MEAGNSMTGFLNGSPVWTKHVHGWWLHFGLCQVMCPKMSHALPRVVFLEAYCRYTLIKTRSYFIICFCMDCFGFLCTLLFSPTEGADGLNWNHSRDTAQWLKRRTCQQLPAPSAPLGNYLHEAGRRKKYVFCVCVCVTISVLNKS